MKLKNIIISTYIVLVFIPVFLIFGLYKWVEYENNRYLIEDYININKEASKYEKILSDKNLYLYPIYKKEIVKVKDKDSVKIEMYNNDGDVLYSTDQEEYNFALSKEELYKGLYDKKEDFYEYSIKRPVFNGEKIIGIYEISIARNKWHKVVQKNIFISIGIFVAIIILLFIIVLKILNKKLNRPLKLLTDALTSYAIHGKRVEIEYKAKDEIGNLIKHFNDMESEMDKIRKEKEYMISSISHDLKSPLTSIRAYAESLYTKNELENDNIDKYVSIIIKKSDYMKDMINELLTYTVLTMDKPMKLIEVDGQEFFDMLFQGYEENCIRKSIKLTCQNETKGIYHVNVNNMIRLMDNLFYNALRYTPQNGEILIGAYSNGSYEQALNIETKELKNEIRNFADQKLLVVVKNSGDGIPKKECEKIFNPFYQIDKARNKNSSVGTGLGLSIVKMIVNKHGGDIKAFSDESTFTIISFKLP